MIKIELTAHIDDVLCIFELLAFAATIQKTADLIDLCVCVARQLFAVAGIVGVQLANVVLHIVEVCESLVEDIIRPAALLFGTLGKCKNFSDTHFYFLLDWWILFPFLWFYYIIDLQ